MGKVPENTVSGTFYFSSFSHAFQLFFSMFYSGRFLCECLAFIYSFCLVLGVPREVIFRELLKRVWFFHKRGDPRFRTTVQRFGLIFKVGSPRKL